VRLQHHRRGQRRPALAAGRLLALALALLRRAVAALAAAAIDNGDNLDAECQ
jgi:hypothetical protein